MDAEDRVKQLFVKWGLWPSKNDADAMLKGNFQDSDITVHKEADRTTVFRGGRQYTVHHNDGKIDI